MFTQFVHMNLNYFVKRRSNIRVLHSNTGTKTVTFRLKFNHLWNKLQITSGRTHASLYTLTLLFTIFISIHFILIEHHAPLCLSGRIIHVVFQQFIYFFRQFIFNEQQNFNIIDVCKLRTIASIKDDDQDSC